MLEHSDLTPIVGEGADWDLLKVYMDDVWAQAVAEAPCLTDAGLDPVKRDAAKSVLRQAVLRWWRAGEGGITTLQETSGPFTHSTTYDHSARGEGRLFEGEIRRLQKLCESAPARRKAFTIMPRLG